MSKSSIIQAQLKGVKSRADRTFDVTVNTRELQGYEAAFLMGELMNEGYFQWVGNEADIEDVPDEKADAMTGTKTQAQRLRAVLFVLWKQRGEKGSAEDFYRSYMEKIIDQIKAKLEGE